MKIIPVIDILEGVVVHAVRGKRKEYKPLRSLLFSSTNPVEIAMAFAELGFNELYIADLTAIAGLEPSYSLFRKIVEKTGLELMVDAGVASLDAVKKLINSQVARVIIGTETLCNLSFVAEAIESFGDEKIIISLDLMGNKIVSGFKLGRLSDPVSLLRKFYKMGVSQIVVLDLMKVGSREGVNFFLLGNMLSNIDARFFIGGGVRDFADLENLKSIGVFGVLMATALHSGKISMEGLKQRGLFV